MGVNRKWSEILSGDTSDQQNPYLKISQHMQERLRFRGL